MLYTLNLHTGRHTVWQFATDFRLSNCPTDKCHRRPFIPTSLPVCIYTCFTAYLVSLPPISLPLSLFFNSKNYNHVKQCPNKLWINWIFLLFFYETIYNNVQFFITSNSFTVNIIFISRHLMMTNGRTVIPPWHVAQKKCDYVLFKVYYLSMQAYNSSDSISLFFSSSPHNLYLMVELKKTTTKVEIAVKWMWKVKWEMLHHTAISPISFRTAKSFLCSFQFVKTKTQLRLSIYCIHCW